MPIIVFSLQCILKGCLLWEMMIVNFFLMVYCSSPVVCNEGSHRSYTNAMIYSDF